MSSVDDTIPAGDGPVQERRGLRRTLSSIYNGSNDFDFVRLFKPGLVIAGIVVLLSLTSLFTRGLNLGIDFEGGGVWEVPVTDVGVEDARSALEGVGQGGATIQVVTNADGTTILRVEAEVDAIDRSREITGTLAELAGTTTEEVNVNTVGPTWGEEITNQAQRALVIFFILITLWISWRLEWRMAVGALVAMVHDLLLSVGVYSVFQIQVTPATLISFLTILGYSLYDTIVVFDRAKENAARTVQRTPYRFIMNRTLNQTLMRSVNTTLATIIPIISLLVIGRLLGADTLEEFSLALLIGLASGAYSSLFVAAPIVSILKEREPKFAYTEGAGTTSALPATASTGTRRRQPRPSTTTTPAPGGAAPTGVIPPRPRKNKRRS